MIPDVRPIVQSQFLAALEMLEECIRVCPADAWDAPIAKYPFWLVAYHTLCCTDGYLAKDETSFRPRTGPGGFHPAGMADIEDEYPSRHFEREELLGYVDLCKRLAAATISGESDEVLGSHCGFPRHKLSRLELHLYSMRHIAHHTGQLAAALRRINVDTHWVKAAAPPA